MAQRLTKTEKRELAVKMLAKLHNRYSDRRWWGVLYNKDDAQMRFLGALDLAETFTGVNRWKLFADLKKFSIIDYPKLAPFNPPLDQPIPMLKVDMGTPGVIFFQPA